MIGNYIDLFLNKAAENPLVVIILALLLLYAGYMLVLEYLKLRGWRKRKMETEKEIEKIDKQIKEQGKSIKSKRDEILRIIKGK